MFINFFLDPLDYRELSLKILDRNIRSTNHCNIKIKTILRLLSFYNCLSWECAL